VKQKLSRDLAVLEAMAGEMEEYLNSEVLFWQIMKGGVPKLTLGGYLMREHRLLALFDLLDEPEQARLNQAVNRFNQALVEKIVRLEEKIHRELEARIRQWSEYLKDLEWERTAAVASYRSAVEIRAMIAALVDKLQIAPYHIDPRFPRQIKLLDSNLRRKWRSGGFLWHHSWQPAYPPADYWWLYGRPNRSSK
jgi:hypothetical protein